MVQLAPIAAEQASAVVIQEAGNWSRTALGESPPDPSTPLLLRNPLRTSKGQEELRSRDVNPASGASCATRRMRVCLARHPGLVRACGRHSSRYSELMARKSSVVIEKDEHGFLRLVPRAEGAGRRATRLRRLSQISRRRVE